jgi:hypothetical protein
VRKRRLKTVNEKLRGKKAKGCPGYARDYMAARGHPRRSFNATKQEYDFAALGQPRVFLSRHAKKRARERGVWKHELFDLKKRNIKYVRKLDGTFVVTTTFCKTSQFKKCTQTGGNGALNLGTFEPSTRKLNRYHPTSSLDISLNKRLRKWQRKKKVAAPKPAPKKKRRKKRGRKTTAPKKRKKKKKKKAGLKS